MDFYKDFMHHTDLFFKNLQWLQLLGIKISRLQQAHLVYLINKNKQLLSKIICQQVTAHENTWLSCTSGVMSLSLYVDINNCTEHLISYITFSVC